MESAVPRLPEPGEPGDEVSEVASLVAKLERRTAGREGCAQC